MTADGAAAPSGPPSRLAELLLTLQGRARRGMELGLGPTRAALADLGDPHAGLAAVHVAGSNGKGSTSAMVESIARAAGLSTGLYTSPHLCRFDERIRIDGEPIGPAALERALGRVLEQTRTELTFFESLTVAAFDAFREARVDLAILEVGLGGRLDATNVIAAPLCTAVTSIALEHTAVLGGTIDAIAREKAGISKPGSPVVLGPLPPEANRAIREIAAAVGAGPIWQVTGDAPGNEDGGASMDRLAVNARGDEVEIRAPDGRSARARVGLAGPHQARNAGVAAGIAWRLAARWPAVAEAIPSGLAAVRWPGRLERVERDGVLVLLDCAHNPEGAAALAQALPSLGAAPERTTLVFGALADKSWREMLELALPLAARRVYTLPAGRAPAPLEALAAIAPGEGEPDPRAAIARALAAARAGDLVVVTGSSYLVGEIRGALLGIACDPVIPL